MREAAQSPPSEEEERKEEEEDKEEEQQQKIVEDEKDEGDEEQMDTDDCGVCPETQLSDNDSVQDVTMVLDGGAQNSLELPSVETFLRGDSPVRDQQQGKEEEEEVAETKTEERIPGCGDDATVGEEKEVKEDRSNPDVEEIQNRVLERSGSPDLEVAVVPLSPKTSVDCPLCQGSFPVSEIEMHAAYCDGEVAVVSHRRSEGDGYQESGKLRRKKMRRAERTAESVCRNQEKCYICQREVPLRDYSRHTELCLLHETSRTTAKENLLSALEQTENRDSAAGPSGSKTQPEVVIDLLDDDEEEEKEEEPAAFRVSNSPIRSFTPISEATGCLIDFKKQQRAKKPSQRRR